MSEDLLAGMRLFRLSGTGSITVANALGRRWRNGGRVLTPVWSGQQVGWAERRWRLCMNSVQGRRFRNRRFRAAVSAALASIRNVSVFYIGISSVLVSHVRRKTEALQSESVPIHIKSIHKRPIIFF